MELIRFFSAAMLLIGAGAVASGELVRCFFGDGVETIGRDLDAAFLWAEDCFILVRRGGDGGGDDNGDAGLGKKHERGFFMGAFLGLLSGDF